MIYVKPDFYENFHCLAGKCPDTCCAGWQIAIDEDSLERYARVKGPLGRLLERSIDWEEGVFRQDCGHCSLLTEDKLCGLYPELGEESLCAACREYPRHVEEYPGRRELSLGLSCPETARLLALNGKRLSFEEYETAEEEELLEEFEEFDYELFSVLKEAENTIFRILQDGSVSLYRRMDEVLSLAGELQNCLDHGHEGEMGEVVRGAEELFFTQRTNRTEDDTARLPGIKESRYAKMRRLFNVFRHMEPLREEWPDILQETWDTLYENGEETYMGLCRDFQDACRKTGETEWDLAAENFAVYFAYIYICGAVYDGWIYSKAALAVFFVCWIRELTMARWALHCGGNPETAGGILRICAEMAYRLTREAEHSDQNLDTMEEWLQEHKF